jgi:hypothetical protein
MTTVSLAWCFSLPLNRDTVAAFALTEAHDPVVLKQYLAKGRIVPDVGPG